jgi:hypothetical protein
MSSPLYLMGPEQEPTPEPVPTDARLDPEFVRVKLLEQFEKYQTPGLDEYTADTRLFMNKSEITIYNHGKECCVLAVPIVNDTGKYVINVELIYKCSNERNSGNKNIINIINFGVNNDYDLIVLRNISTLDFTFGRDILDINLTYLKLLMTGNSWYANFGFNNDMTKQFEPFLLQFINLSFEQLVHEYNECIDSFPIRNKDEMKSEFFANINGYLRVLSTIDDVKDANLQTVIKDYFSNLQRFIFTVCPNNKCPESFRDTFTRINNFIHFILDVIFKIIFCQKLKLPGQSKNPFYIPANKMLEQIKNTYILLTLDLRELRASRGGKLKIRTKTKTRRSTKTRTRRRTKSKSKNKKLRKSTRNKNKK